MERHIQHGLSFIANEWPLCRDKPTLFFIHAAGASASSWTFQIDGLKEIANTIAIDLPGHGKSRTPGCSKICDYAKVLTEFMEKVGFDVCIPVGISMGGAITLHLLTEYSEKFCAGILISTGAKLRVLPEFFNAIEANPRGFLANLLNFVLPPDSKSDRFTPVINDILDVKKHIILGDFSACNEFDIRNRLCDIMMPVLILSSSSDTMTPLWYGEYLNRNIKSSELKIIENAGHLVNIDKSEIVNQAISDFIINLAVYKR